MRTIKSFTLDEVQEFRDRVRGNLNKHPEYIAANREWMAVDLLTLTGMRVSEVTNVTCSDIRNTPRNTLNVRSTKSRGGHRIIEIPPSLEEHLLEFIEWKRNRGESVEDGDPIFIGQRGKWTRQAIQQIVKKYLKTSNNYTPGKSVHAFRHSYAVFLFNQGYDIKEVKSQLGHSEVASTQIYLDNISNNECLKCHIRNMYNEYEKESWRSYLVE